MSTHDRHERAYGAQLELRFGTQDAKELRLPEQGETNGCCGLRAVFETARSGSGAKILAIEAIRSGTHAYSGREGGGSLRKVVKDDPRPPELRDRLNAISRGKKIVLVVFIIWAIQAIPKWTVAIVGDGETSAAIMKIFVTPR